MNVLVACEFSGIVRDAFTRRGHYAVSCDLLPSERKGMHYQGDVRDILTAYPWDLMIAHPPCTHLASSGRAWFKYKQQEQEEALAFIRELLHAPILRICLENPVGIISTRICKPSQIIQPWQFGHPVTKTTCLWLKNLPVLKPTRVVELVGESRKDWSYAYAAGMTNGSGVKRQLARSRTFEGIARAMAQQWG